VEALDLDSCDPRLSNNRSSLSICVSDLFALIAVGVAGYIFRRILLPSSRLCGHGARNFVISVMGRMIGIL
jgi:hypothetical protein